MARCARPRAPFRAKKRASRSPASSAYCSPVPLRSRSLYFYLLPDATASSPTLSPHFISPSSVYPAFDIFYSILFFFLRLTNEKLPVRDGKSARADGACTTFSSRRRRKELREPRVETEPNELAGVQPKVETRRGRLGEEKRACMTQNCGEPWQAVSSHKF